MLCDLTQLCKWLFEYPESARNQPYLIQKVSPLYSILSVTNNLINKSHTTTHLSNLYHSKSPQRFTPHKAPHLYPVVIHYVPKYSMYRYNIPFLFCYLPHPFNGNPDPSKILIRLSTPSRRRHYPIRQSRLDLHFRWRVGHTQQQHLPILNCRRHPDPPYLHGALNPRRFRKH